MTNRTAPKSRPKRSPAKVRLGNLRVTPHCAKVLRRHAEKRGIYPAHAMADVLEGWAKRQGKAGGKPRG